MASTLPISRIVRVSVSLAPRAAQAQDLKTLLILGTSNVIDVVERRRTYSTLAQVADDFGTSAPEYLAAALWFEQSPQPFQLMIGRWADAPTNGKLLCATLSANASAIATWQAISNGGFVVSLNGAPQNLSNLDFGAQTNLNGVADVITAALPGAEVVYNSVFNRFEFTANTTGPTSTVSFLTTGTGTDIAALLGGESGGGGYVADGIDAETAVAAVTLFDGMFGQQWYAIAVIGTVNDDVLAISQYIQGANNKHLYGVTTQEPGVLSSVSTTDIAYLLEQLGRNRTMVQYSSQNAYAVVSALGRILTVDYNGNNTTITLKFKQEPGIVAETLSESQVAAAEAKNANLFLEYNNDTAIFEQGVMSNGDFVDEITGTDWLALTIQTAIYNVLYTSPTKIPQTDAGMHILATTIESVCSQGVINGLLAPGVWNSQGFGTLVEGGFLDKGFYVYAPPVAQQLQADREARKSVLFQVAAKLAGAVHSVDVAITVNR
jgi:hypothetical protein